MKPNRILKTLLASIASLALAACGSSQTAPQQPPSTADQPSDQHEDMSETCPMKVAGTTAAAEEPDGAAALVFTTTGDVGELRRRVAKMAAMHGMHEDGDMHSDDKGGMHQGGMHKDGKMMKMPAATATTEEIAGGMRVVLTPKDPAALAEVRAHAKMMAEKMQGGECPMMDKSDTPPADEGAEHDGHHPETTP
jgi:hypothetical protein